MFKSKLLLAIFGLFIVVSAGCSGCLGTPYYSYKKGATPDHITNVKIVPIWLDANFSAERKEAIKEAIKEWNSVFNGQIVLRIESEFVGGDEAVKLYRTARRMHQGWIIAQFKSDDESLEGMVEPGDGTLAFVLGIGTGNIMFVIDDHIGFYDVKNIVLHEMGHLLGAFHVNARSLMAPRYGLGKDAVGCVDKITAAQVAGYQNLDIKTLSYCVLPNFE